MENRHVINDVITTVMENDDEVVDVTGVFWVVGMVVAVHRPSKTTWLVPSPSPTIHASSHEYISLAWM